MQKYVYIIGMGCGSFDLITGQAMDALRRADLFLGSNRVLNLLPDQFQGEHIFAVSVSEQICQILTQNGVICALFSGDTGFYSGAKRLSEVLKQHQIPFDIFPGISSIQVLSARLGRPWQDWILASAHGRSFDILSHISNKRPVCVLTDSASGSPQALCKELTAAGLGDLSVTVGESLACPEERIVTGPAFEMAKQTFGPLSVMLTESAPKCDVTVPGIPDDQFLRGSVPMTKQEIRCLIPSKLALRDDDICWDIGAGTGSISIELALQCREVWAVERFPEAVDLITQNRKKFCAWNLRVIHGSAPDILYHLPVPDAVVIGGSGGHLHGILQCLFSRNSKVRLCITAISLETLSSAIEELQQLGIDPDVTQISASRVKLVGSHHLLSAQNPVFLISGSLP